MRIGLFALSGIRACDPDLLRLGLSLPGVLDRSRVIAQLPSLGLLTLAGMTGPEHEVEYIEVPQTDGIKDLPDGFDLVALSSLTAQVPEAYRLADRFRARGVPVVMGGLHATSLPDEVLQHCDAVVVGEGELAWSRILADAQKGHLRGVYRAEGEFDMRQAPLPAFHLLEADRYHRVTVQVSRGCPLRCEFCASSILLTNRYKTKPLDRVLAEIDRVREIWPRPFLEFADDNAFKNHLYWKALLSELRHRKLRWFAETDIAIHRDEELLDLMRDSGCVELLIGLESPDAPALRGLELRSDWKRRQAPEYVEAVRRIQARGIRVNACFILGLDHHGPEIFDRVYDFAHQTESFDVQVTLLTPFPGTPLHARLGAEGRLRADGQWERHTLFDVTYHPARMSVDELSDGFRGLVARLYDESATRWRHENFSRNYLWPLADRSPSLAAECANLPAMG